MKNIIDNYKKLLYKQQSVADRLSNTQREKDFRVQKLEKQYQSKIDKLLQDEQSIALLIKIIKEFIK